MLASSNSQIILKSAAWNFQCTVVGALQIMKEFKTKEYMHEITSVDNILRRAARNHALNYEHREMTKHFGRLGILQHAKQSLPFGLHVLHTFNHEFFGQTKDVSHECCSNSNIEPPEILSACKFRTINLKQFHPEESNSQFGT